MAGDKDNRMLLRLTEDRLICHANGKDKTVTMSCCPDGSIENFGEVADSLRELSKSADLAAAADAWCFIPARGVTLRQVKLPPTTPANREQFLRLQIEKEFPLSPDELAWGWRQIGNQDNGTEVLVAAIKKELVQPLAVLLRSVDLNPNFVPAVLADGLAAAGNDSSVVANLDGNAMELARFDGGRPASIRTFARNGDDNPQLAERIVKAAAPANRLNFAGDGELAKALESGFAGKVQKIEGSGLEAWEKLISVGKINDLPVLRLNAPAAESRKRTLNLPTRWIALAALLAVGLIGTRYIGPFIGEARLKREIAAIKEKQSGFPAINQEVNFLQHIQQNQPPYLAALAVFSEAAPRGVKVESLNLDRRGEFSFRGQMQSSQQASDLRKKLIESGLFTNVVLEEQSTVPNKRQVNVRFTARWNTDPKAKSDALKRIDAKGKESDSKKPSIPGRR